MFESIWKTFSKSLKTINAAMTAKFMPTMEGFCLMEGQEAGTQLGFSGECIPGLGAATGKAFSRVLTKQAQKILPPKKAHIGWHSPSDSLELNLVSGMNSTKTFACIRSSSKQAVKQNVNSLQSTDFPSDNRISWDTCHSNQVCTLSLFQRLLMRPSIQNTRYGMRENNCRDKQIFFTSWGMNSSSYIIRILSSLTLNLTHAVGWWTYLLPLSSAPISPSQHPRISLPWCAETTMHKHNSGSRLVFQKSWSSVYRNGTEEPDSGNDGIFHDINEEACQSSGNEPRHTAQFCWN